MRVIGIDPSFRACGVSDGISHDIICTRPADGEESLTALRRRCKEVVDGIMRFVGEGDYPAAFFIEAPMLAAPAHGGSHLYELGWLMNDIIGCIEAEYSMTPVLVPILAVKKFASGKGNTKKDDMKLAVYKKFGVEIPKDPGADALHAFVLVKYGEAVLDGSATVAPITRRGGKKKAV